MPNADDFHLAKLVMSDIQADRERQAADKLDRKVGAVAKAERISKAEAYDAFLNTPEGLRAVAEVRLAQGRSEDWISCRQAADEIEAVSKARDG